jgi:hypothetical protein
MREREGESTSAEESLSAARGGSAGAHASVGDNVSDEWAAMLTGSGRATVGRQHFGGSIEEFEDDVSSDHSGEDDGEVSNQPALLFAP